MRGVHLLHLSHHLLLKARLLPLAPQLVLLQAKARVPAQARLLAPLLVLLQAQAVLLLRQQAHLQVKAPARLFLQALRLLLDYLLFLKI